MEKRYQVFVSSTYTDLIDARREASQGLVEKRFMPAGMELFPASNMEQLEFIKPIIDESDCCVIISAGRYGTVGKDQYLSFTELEFNYAVEQGKPIVCFLFDMQSAELPPEHREKSPEMMDRLRRFRTALSNERLVKFWSDPKELRADVPNAVAELVRTNDMMGWVHASEVVDPEQDVDGPVFFDTMRALQEENRRLREEVQALERNARSARLRRGTGGIRNVAPELMDCLEAIILPENRRIAPAEVFERVDRVFQRLGRSSLERREIYDSDEFTRYGLPREHGRALVAALSMDGLLAIDAASRLCKGEDYEHASNLAARHFGS